ncbi:MAG: hypothetical protein IJI24_04415, partial [Lachnospiraceae bacterium]|nr:hypothetical protein [Lachnospiraceae bacterium]
HTNPRVKTSREDECDQREESIRVVIPPMGISIFSATSVPRVLSGNEKARKNKTRGRSAIKNTALAKKRGESLKDELRRKIEEAE